MGRFLEESGQLLHRCFHLRCICKFRQRPGVSEFNRFFLTEIGDLLGPSLVLESRAFLGEPMDGLFVGPVGGQPDLPSQFSVIVC